MAAGTEATGCILPAVREQGLAHFGVQPLSPSDLVQDPSPWNGAAHIQEDNINEIFRNVIVLHFCIEGSTIFHLISSYVKVLFFIFNHS